MECKLFCNRIQRFQENNEWILTFYTFFTDLVDFDLLHIHPPSPDVGIVDVDGPLSLHHNCSACSVMGLRRDCMELLGVVFGLPSTLRQVS